MDEKQHLTPEKIQSKLKSLRRQQSHGSEAASDVGVTVAALRDGFDLKACQDLLQEHGITSTREGRGSGQMVVVPRDNSSRAFGIVAEHRESLRKANPLRGGDYLVGIVAWTLGWGLLLPAPVLMLVSRLSPNGRVGFATVVLVLVISPLLGGFLGYLRCRVVAQRRR